MYIVTQFFWLRAFELRQLAPSMILCWRTGVVQHWSLLPSLPHPNKLEVRSNLTPTAVQILRRFDFSFLILILKASLSFLLHSSIEQWVGTSWISYFLAGRWLGHDFHSNSDGCPRQGKFHMILHSEAFCQHQVLILWSLQMCVGLPVYIKIGFIFFNYSFGGRRKEVIFTSAKMIILTQVSMLLLVCLASASSQWWQTGYSRKLFKI